MYKYTLYWNESYAEEQIAVTELIHREHVAEHMHDFIEIVYLHAGRAIHYIDDVPYSVNPGDILMIAIGQKHMIKLQSNTTLISEVLVSPSFIDEMLKSMENLMDILALSTFKEYDHKLKNMITHLQLRGQDVLQVEHILKSMLIEYESKELNYKTTLKSYLIILLNLIFRTMYKQQSHMIQHHLNRLTPDILKYINENLHEKLTLHDLAEKTFYNPSYFSKMFKQCYGKTFVDYINEKRLDKSVELLCKTNKTLDSISRECGFSNSKYFSKLFKQKYLMTPGSFRKERQADVSKNDFEEGDRDE